MKSRRPIVRPVLSTSRVVAVAMAAVATVLVLGLVFLGRWTALIGRESTNVVSNALPSTKYLGGARTALRALDADMNQSLVRRESGQPFDRAGIDRDRRLLGADLDVYRALPMYPGEPERLQLMMAELGRFDAAIEKGLLLIANGDLPRAREFEIDAWRVASNRLDESIRSLQEFNAQHLEEHALRIHQIWRVALFGTVLLGVLCALLSGFSGALAIRTIRRQQRFLEDRAAELELFSARVAHDLMSPLGSVAIALQVAERTSSDSQIVQLSRRGLSSMRRLHLVVRALLEFARAGGVPAAAKTALPSLVPELLDELRSLATQERVELSCGPIPESEVACTPGILHVVLSNLIRNAIQWMGQSEIRRVELQIVTGDGRVRFEVRDSGPGVPAEAQRRLFEPFARPAPTGIPGFGLGLATVKRLVEGHGGVVGVHPAEGRGTVFWFELPSAAA